MNTEALLMRYPQLEKCKESIEKAEKILLEQVKKGAKIILCGNGGSAADCDHIVGELMKGFLNLRPLSDKDKEKLKSLGGEEFASRLQYGIPAISLCSQSAVVSAFCNDVLPEAVYAQLMYGYAAKGDVAICISTSGNSKNVVNAGISAKAKGAFVISLTGERTARLDEISDVVIKVLETETYKIQELHLPVYHYLCARLEYELFGK